MSSEVKLCGDGRLDSRYIVDIDAVPASGLEAAERVRCLFGSQPFQVCGHLDARSWLLLKSIEESVTSLGFVRGRCSHCETSWEVFYVPSPLRHNAWFHINVCRELGLIGDPWDSRYLAQVVGGTQLAILRSAETSTQPNGAAQEEADGSQQLKNRICEELERDSVGGSNTSVACVGR